MIINGFVVFLYGNYIAHVDYFDLSLSRGIRLLNLVGSDPAAGARM